MAHEDYSIRPTPTRITPWGSSDKSEIMRSRGFKDPHGWTDKVYNDRIKNQKARKRELKGKS